VVARLLIASVGDLARTLAGDRYQDAALTLRAVAEERLVERGHRDEIRRVRKIDERKPIDAVPAMALAVWRATHAVENAEPLIMAF
jgi:hypothetical protein